MMLVVAVVVMMMMMTMIIIMIINGAVVIIIIIITPPPSSTKQQQQQLHRHQQQNKTKNNSVSFCNVICQSMLYSEELRSRCAQGTSTEMVNSKATKQVYHITHQLVTGETAATTKKCVAL